MEQRAQHPMPRKFLLHCNHKLQELIILEMQWFLYLVVFCNIAAKGKDPKILPICRLNTKIIIVTQLATYLWAQIDITVFHIHFIRAMK